MEAIGRLAGGIAHDFNNLLTAIAGYTRLLLESLEEDDPRRDDALQIEEAAGRAAALTGRLLTFSRGGMLQPTRLDLNDLLTSARPFLASVLGERIELRVDLRASRPWIVAERSQLDQVLVDLASNARDAMAGGGVFHLETDDLDAPTAWRQGLPSDRFVLLTVSDTGIGIAEDVREQVFEPFFTTKGPGERCGLGLSSVYATVRQAGGRIRLLSEPGRGTTFRILLPVADDASTQASPAATGPCRPARILLVEDEAAVRDLVTRILTDAGHTVVAARGGEEALGLASAGPPVELLLSDVVMPGMSGIQLARELRARQAGLGVLLMSGYTAEPLGAADAGFDLLPKPFTADELLDRVRRLLDARPAATEPRLA
jgi:CheY-like chemotaxis protein